MAKKASKSGYYADNFEADQGCGGQIRWDENRRCKSNDHCDDCLRWLDANPGKILNKPKKKTVAKAAGVEAIARSMFDEMLATALDAKLAAIRGDVYALAGRHDTTRLRLDLTADRASQLRAELTAALARISALEASANLNASPKPENAPAAKPGSDSAVPAPTADDQPAPGYRIVRSSVDIDPMKCRRWRWAYRDTGETTSWFSEATTDGLDLPKHLHADWNRGDADCEVPAVPFKSSADRLPRVGDVVLYLNDPQEWTITRADFAFGNGNNGCAWIQKAPWERGDFTIVSEGPDPHVCNAYDNQAAVIAEREKAAWNAAIDAADVALAAEGWHRNGESRLRVNGLRK